MGNNPSRFGGYPDVPYSYDRGMSYGPGMQRGWSDSYKRNRSNSAGWYPGELGYQQSSNYPQAFPQYMTMPQPPQLIAQPVQYVQAMPVPQQQPQIVYQQVPVQTTVMPQPVIPSVPTTGRRPVIPAFPQAQYQAQPTASMPEPVIPDFSRQDRQVPIVTQPVVQMPEPEPAPPGPGPPPEPSIPFPEPNVIPPMDPRIAPGQYSAFNRPPTPTRNPPPAPPKDLFESSPYMRLLQELKRPINEASIRRSHTVQLPQSTPVYNAMPQHNAQPQYGIQPDRKNKKGGLLRSLSARLNRRRHHNDSDDSDDPSRSAGQYGVAPMMQTIPEGSTFMYASVLPTANPSPVGGMGATPAGTPMPMPVPSPGPPSRPATPRPSPIRIERSGPYGDLLHSSQHRVMWNHKRYPTAAHLLEAWKFLDHQPDLAERVRTCPSADDAMAISASMRDHVRPDWEDVAVQLMEEVLYQKFIQHDNLCRLLLSTGTAELIYGEVADSYWGDGPVGQGFNELGKALMRVRDRLRQEGLGTPAVHPTDLHHAR